MEEEDVRRDRGLSVFRLCAVSRLTSVVCCTGIGCSFSTQVFGFWFVFGWCCVVFLCFFVVSAWWNRGIAEEVTMASYGKAVTGTAVMARSANEKKKVARIEKQVEANVVEQVQPEVPVIEPTVSSESDSSAPSELGIDDLEVADVADPSSWV